MSVLERLARQQASRPQKGSGGKVMGIYHQWHDGANRFRLAGDFLEVRTHFIAPAAKRKDRGLCQATAFQGDDKIPQVINCLDWDIATERPKKEKTCPICKLNAIARVGLSENPNDDEKKFLEALRSATRATATLKWNIIDRDDPMVTVSDNGVERKVKGFKIASIGPEAQTDVMGIFKQVGYDIQDPDRGIDIEVTKASGGTRTTYSARAVIEGTSLKVTPFTAEERDMTMHDLKVRCGKLTDGDKIRDALHEDLRALLDIDINADDTVEVDDATVEAAVEEAVLDVSEPEPVKSVQTTRPATQPDNVASKVPSSVMNRLAKKTVAVAEPSDDGDGLLDGTSTKKN